MGETMSPRVRALMAERFGHDVLISVATIEDGKPHVRMVNSYYENGVFYTVTHALSGKMKQIGKNPVVAICGEWFTGHGLGENMGHIRDERNAALAAKLREVFSAWYSNGHTDEADPNTCILRVRLTDGILLHHGTRYDLDFTETHTDTSQAHQGVTER